MERSPITLVTGGSGFIGRALLSRLERDGHTTRAVVRVPREPVSGRRESVVWQGLETPFDLEPALSGCESVVHAAARVHVMRDSASDPLTEYRRVNVDGTLRLARQAAAAGVRRFVFVSSIKVNGESTQPGHPFRADDAPAPADAYGQSKQEAEAGLRVIAAAKHMEVVIVRPVLVYGPGVSANFLTMLRWVWRGIPLPFGAIHNARSFVATENLVDLLATALRHPGAANQTLLVSDGEDLSTTELLVRAGMALGRPSRLFRAPARALKLAARIAGKREVARRLLDSLQVDIRKTRDQLGWNPPVSVDAGLRATAAWFLERERAGG